MGKKESVPNRRYTEEFKSEAVRLALSTGGNAAAKRLGVPQSTMTNCTGSDCLDTVLQLRLPCAGHKPDGLPGVT